MALDNDTYPSRFLSQEAAGHTHFLGQFVQFDTGWRHRLV
jgi:hypothetical protein